ncbi:flavodoxin domain-containing protein [Georgenia thermotolerans]|uniref:Flavodoxin n=1 Tax=Georgenia thermotolerans TaxID=527326 RepID=A0A7J5ULK1_9MICO|nr:flavodoxin domain-containing protein [Georgenia thermotolerans]KAE8763258.1 flavodoxin [Georgenia thermotolerans]
MSGKVLVAFASRHGSTREIAQTIAAVLREKGRDVDVTPVADVIDLGAYEAVVVGCAVYHGRSMAEGRSFLRRLARQFPDRPVWVFSSGPTGEDPLGDPAEVAKRASAAPAVPADVARDAAGADLRGHVTFPGRVGEDAVDDVLERSMPRGDWRNLEHVAAWARQIDAELKDR